MIARYRRTLKKSIMNSFCEGARGAVDLAESQMLTRSHFEFSKKRRRKKMAREQLALLKMTRKKVAQEKMATEKMAR